MPFGKKTTIIFGLSRYRQVHNPSKFKGRNFESLGFFAYFLNFMKRPPATYDPFPFIASFWLWMERGRLEEEEEEEMKRKSESWECLKWTVLDERVFIFLKEEKLFKNTNIFIAQN